MADRRHEQGEQDQLLARAVEELRTLQPADERAVSRIVQLAAALPQTGELDEADLATPAADPWDEEGVRSIDSPPRRARTFRRRWTIVVGAALAAGLATLALLREDPLADAGRQVAASEAVPAAAPAPSELLRAAGAEALAQEEAPIVTQFVVDLPDARTVSLVGDFNGWNSEATPLVRHPASGRWTVELPLTPGRHRYAFVVDGTTWTLDPRAPRANDPDFGSPTSVIVVGVR